MKETKKATPETEVKEQYEATEIVEGLYTYFILGPKKDKQGAWLCIKGQKETKALITLYIAGDEEKGTRANFKDFAVSEKNFNFFKEQGFDLKEKSKQPVKIRFTIREYYKDNKNNIIRELTNIAHKQEGTWVWAYQPKPKEDKTTKSDLKTFDLPF